MTRKDDKIYGVMYSRRNVGCIDCLPLRFRKPSHKIALKKERQAVNMQLTSILADHHA